MRSRACETEISKSRRKRRRRRRRKRKVHSKVSDTVCRDVNLVERRRRKKGYSS